MIRVQIVNDQFIYLNPSFIEAIEASAENNKHCTVVKIHDGTTYVVKETPEEIVDSIMQWRRTSVPCLRGEDPAGGRQAGDSP